jgi:two-component system OmpR family sensor kinase
MQDFKLRLRWTWLLAFLPITTGLILFLILNSGWINNPIAFIRADIGTWLLFFSILLTILLSFLFALQEWALWYRDDIQEQSNDERRRFLLRLDHELKNPLTAIRAGLVNLAESPTEETRLEALESVQTQTLRLSRLAADLRKLAELEIRPVERTPVDIGELVEDAFTIAQDQPGSKDRRLVLTIPRAPWPVPTVSGDRDLLFLAIHNLINNAIKFSRPGDTVEVRVFEDGSSVAIEVADTGPGIPEEEIPLVWEELYRGRGARGVPGSGLGLAIVRAVAERHEGRVTLRSREGQGTVFSLRLPV